MLIRIRNFWRQTNRLSKLSSWILIFLYFPRIRNITLSSCAAGRMIRCPTRNYDSNTIFVTGALRILFIHLLESYPLGACLSQHSSTTLIVVAGFQWTWRLERTRQLRPYQRDHHYCYSISLGTIGKLGSSHIPSHPCRLFPMGVQFPAAKPMCWASQ